MVKVIKIQSYTEELEAENRLLRDQNERLKVILGALAFDSVSQVRNKADAMFVFGFSPNTAIDARLVAMRYKMLACVFHPDSSELGSTARMAKLNAAYQILARV
ncbi:MAG: hypothetical protein FWF01_00025 [Alphaproteobacteria bacterium]|nr:hypothetical protein [Alphaproteobacteria bacterium]